MIPETICNDLVTYINTNYAGAPWPVIDQALRLVSLQWKLAAANGGVLPPPLVPLPSAA